MLKTLTIKGFRCFRELHVEPLTRVNLFVGRNGSGKTSLLDAAELVAMGSVEGLARSAVRRGELILSPAVLTQGEEKYSEHVVDPSHLFFGHEIKVNKPFRIEAEGETAGFVECNPEHALSNETVILTLRFVGHLTPKGHADRLTISPAGGVLPPPRRRAEANPSVNFLKAEGVDAFSLNQLWDRVVLTPEEETVIRGLRIIEPRADRLAFLSRERNLPPVILAKLSSLEQRLPLATLGGGMEHMLAVALNLASAQRGFLLVDEIDTGLHHSVMVDMWRLVIETAQRLDIQVFATTHSLDCVRALARLCRKYPEVTTEVQVHRVERDTPETVVYGADDIVIAAEGHIEVR